MELEPILHVPQSYACRLAMYIHLHTLATNFLSAHTQAAKAI